MRCRYDNSPLDSHLLLPPLLISTLFPYTTLFRSLEDVFHQRPRIEAVDIHGDHIRSPRAPQNRIGDLAREARAADRSEEHTSELQSRRDLVCRLLLEKKKQKEDYCKVYGSINAE